MEGRCRTLKASFLFFSLFFYFGVSSAQVEWRRLRPHEGGSKGIQDRFRGRNLEVARVSSNSLPRQYDYYGSYSGGIDLTTLIAVSAFAALIGALFFQLLGGTAFRSGGLGSVSWNLPSILGLGEGEAEIMTKVFDWLVNTSWSEKEDSLKRSFQSSSEKYGIYPWIYAYQKDPNEYQCVRQYACETLAATPIPPEYFKSPIGRMVMSTVKKFVPDGDEIVRTVKSIAGNPQKCKNPTISKFCEGEKRSSTFKRIH